MSRPRKNYPDDVAKFVDQMIADYEKTGEVKALTDYRLVSLAGVSVDTMERWYNGEADKALQNDPDTAEDIKDRYTKRGYSEAVKKLTEYRRATCVEHLTQDRFNTGWIFLSKQPHWGGFQDIQRVESKGTQSIKICIADSDGKPLSE